MIRPLTVDDLDDFITIRMKALRLHPEAFGAAYEEGIDRQWTKENLAAKNDEDFILGYFEEGKLVGTIGFVRQRQKKKRHKARIWGMFVDPDYGRKGVGSQLLRLCLQRAGQLSGLEIVQLSVTSEADGARKLYEKAGFRTWGVEKQSLKLENKYVDEIHMSIVLK